MLFYPSKTNDTLNRNKPFYPDRIVGRVMLNPVRPIKKLAPGTLVICDSGAFQDLGVNRLLPWTALNRQLRYEEQLRWRLGDADWHFEALCIYDQMAGVDEKVVNGRKIKVRGTRETAERAVQETLESTRYYASQRQRIRGSLCFVGQGIDPDQYLNACVLPMRDMMQPEDWFAFGGFCITGRQRQRMLPIFYETYIRCLDALIPAGIRRFHLLGVCIPEAVVFAAQEAAKRGVVVSTDSSAIEVASVIRGAVYVNGRYKKSPWTRADKYINYCPVDLAHANIKSYHEWSTSLC